MLVFDIETNGLLGKLDRVHSLVFFDTELGVRFSVATHDSPHALPEALNELMYADEICGQNIIAFDIPAIQKVYPWFAPTGRIVDTTVLSRLLYPDMLDRDIVWDKKKRGKWIPRNLFGRHSLESWGHRLGEFKDDYSKRMKAEGKDPWAEWNPLMQSYCEQDVEVTVKLVKKLLAKNPTVESFELEHGTQQIIFRQERRGFAFDEQAAQKLHAELVGKQTFLESELKKVFPPFFAPNGLTKPKRSMKRKNDVTGIKDEITEGAQYMKVKLVQFNPGSRDHIGKRLQVQFGWRPAEYGKDGKPTVDETILKGLPYEFCPLLVDYLTLDKRIGMLATGKQAWLKQAKDGRIHGRVNTNGAVTGRMTHSNPNVAQVPAVRSPYGPECRDLFVAGRGYSLVGIDAEGLELRALGHYLARWDAGAYGNTVVNGNKEDETDVHNVNKRAIGLNSRDSAKTFVYAFLYGAGNMKLGHIIYIDDMTPDQRRQFGSPTERKLSHLGKKSRDSFAENIPGLKKFIDAVKKVAKRGYLKGLDGRRLKVRALHAAPNTLLQSAGAIVMKRALLFHDQLLQDGGFIPGEDYEYVCNVHDELQVEARPAIADEVGRVGCDAIRLAGKHFNFRCELAGDYSVGDSWRETH